MASVKIASLFLKTLAKPISQKLKQQAREHEGFREATINMAQVGGRLEFGAQESSVELTELLGGCAAVSSSG